MYNQYTSSPEPRPIAVAPDPYARLNWLLSVNAHERQVARAYRRPSHKDAMLLMRRPLSANRAYALLGMATGLIPPFAIMAKMFHFFEVNSLSSSSNDALILLLMVLVNIVCGLTGFAYGSLLSRAAFDLERASWKRMLVLMPFLGAVWGLLSGASGGFFFFGYGAIAGGTIALPIGMVAFTLFAICHRLLERGGMIDTRHLLPIACGIAMTIAALVLGL